jgi:hypothetical protein
MDLHGRTVHSRGVRAAALLGAGGVLAGAAVAGLIPAVANASSHREAPLIAADPAVDNTDVYAFRDAADPSMINLIGNWIPFEEPNGGPNFYPWATGAAYDFNIDNDGDAVADIVYRWQFSTQDARANNTFLYNTGPVTSLTDADLLFRQTYDLTVSRDGGAFTPVLDDAPVTPSFTGVKSMPDYGALREEAITPLTTGGRSVATQADDSFFLDLRVFDLLYGGDLSETGQDTLAGYNTNTIALQVPADDLALNGDAEGNPVFGVWSTTSRPSLTTRAADGTAASSGPLVQVSRLGMPLVNEVVVPTGLKDAFNALAPANDASVAPVVARVLEPELPALIEGIYGVDAPATPRNDIAQVFLTGITKGYTPLAPGGTPALDIDLNSQMLNADYVDNTFQPSEMLRLNMSIPVTAEPNRLGVIGGDLQGFPNGRRLGDDVLDISVFALEGVYDINAIPQDRLDAGVAALAAGDAVDANQVAFDATFPYVALPNTEAVNQALAGGTTPPPATPAPGTPAPGTPGAGAAPAPGAPAGSGTTPGGTPVAPAPAVAVGADGYPVGGVETGEGGWSHTLAPAVTGGVALLLMGAGAGSLIRGRGLRRATSAGTQV